jgi:hypothetical protein
MTLTASSASETQPAPQPAPAPTPAPAMKTLTRPETTDGNGDVDHLRHIICVVCYPAFEGTREAPQDAVCICGKAIFKGDIPNPRTAPECVVCNELCDHHYATEHPND